MSELSDRFERLAGRGSQRGADAVLNAAMREVPTNEVNPVPDDNSSDLPIIGDDAPMVTTTEAQPRSRMRTIIAVFGVAALVGVGGLAVASIFGNGGAASPEGAVRQLADAIQHKDPLAAVDVLSPTEVRSARDTVKNVTNRAADLKIVNDAGAPLAGVDFSVSDLQLTTESLGDGYTKVIVTGGKLTTSAHTAELSKLLQDATRNADTKNSTETVDLARLGRAEHLPTFVVTVRHDGRWYVSPAYTYLEYEREIEGGPAADFGSAQTAKDLGADTPELAVSDAMHAWQSADWNRLMALVPPDELPVYDYRQWLSEEATQSASDFTIDKLTTTASVSGDTATVQLEGSGRLTSRDDPGTWQVGGTCPNNQIDLYGVGDTNDTSDSSGALDQTYSNSASRKICLAGDLGDVPLGLFAFSAGSEAQPSGPITINAVRENGRWFVSPVTTVLGMVDSMVGHIDERSVYTFLNLAYELPPDGAITLNQPFTVTSRGGLFASSVYTFDGTKGQKVVGESSGKENYATAQIYTAAGKEVDYVTFSTVANGYGYSTTLPETGSYRLVVDGSPRSLALTLWDVKNAPKGLLSGSGGGDSCTSGIGLSETCSSSNSGDFIPPDSSNGGGTTGACSVKNNTFVCPGMDPLPICKNAAEATSPDSNCIPSGFTGVDTLPTGTGDASSSGSGSSPAPTTPARSVTATTGVATSVP